MSARVDQFCNKLRDRLTTIEGRLKSVKTNIRVLPEEAERTLWHKLTESQTKLQVQRNRVEQIRVNLKARAQQQISVTKMVNGEWKAMRGARKLNNRAVQTKTYTTALDYAAACIGEAEEAILEAGTDRINTDEAVASSL